MTHRIDHNQRAYIAEAVAQRFARGENLDIGKIARDYRLSPGDARNVFYDVKIRNASAKCKGEKCTYILR